MELRPRREEDAVGVRKTRPVLYEVVRRTRREREAGWRQKILSPLGRQSEAVASEADVGAHEEPTPILMPVNPPQAGPVVIKDGKLHMAFGWISGVAIGLALVLLLWVAYDAGRRSAAPSNTSTDVVDGASTIPSGAELCRRRAPDARKRRRGHQRDSPAAARNAEHRRRTARAGADHARNPAGARRPLHPDPGFQRAA